MEPNKSPQSEGNQPDQMGGEIDFDTEAENLQENSGWFNPDPGSHIVKFIDNGEMQTREYDGEKRQVGVFTVEVDGEEMKWSITKGATPSSLWGQLMRYAQEQDTLEGEEITIIRNGTGQDTNYVIQEAANL